jgi:hypothetical protein
MPVFVSADFMNHVYSFSWDVPGGLYVYAFSQVLVYFPSLLPFAVVVPDNAGRLELLQILIANNYAKFI